MEHSDLKNSYNQVGNKIHNLRDFEISNLKISTDLFKKSSLHIKSPVPKKLEVFALLSGLPFTKSFTESLVNVQKEISDIIIDSLHYWVKPSNFGVEYCVFKWPEDNWGKNKHNRVKNSVLKISESSFCYNVIGIQINPDGCVVARGYDQFSSIYKIRNYLRSEIDFFPKRQSGWAHIPLGRILEPIGEGKFQKLKSYIRRMSNKNIAKENIYSIKYVHEQQWYMEQKSILLNHPLN